MNLLSTKSYNVIRLNDERTDAKKITIAEVDVYSKADAHLYIIKSTGELLMEQKHICILAQRATGTVRNQIARDINKGLLVKGGVYIMGNTLLKPVSYIAHTMRKYYPDANILWDGDGMKAYIRKVFEVGVMINPIPVLALPAVASNEDILGSALSIMKSKQDLIENNPLIAAKVLCLQQPHEKTKCAEYLTPYTMLEREGYLTTTKQVRALSQALKVNSQECQYQTRKVSYNKEGFEKPSRSYGYDTRCLGYAYAYMKEQNFIKDSYALPPAK